MKTQQTFEELTGLFADYLRQIRRREDTICRYAQLWARIKIFMDSRHMQFYNKQVGEAYLTFLFGDTEYSRLKKYYQVLWNSVEALAEFQATGTVLMGKRRNPSIQLNGPIGAIMENFVNYKRSSHQIGDLTTYNYRFYLTNYLSFLNNREIETIGQITSWSNLQFIDSLRQRNPGTRHTILMIIKRFLRYLFERDFTPVDYSMSIPKDNCKKQAHLPSSFSRHEVKVLLDSIDRGGPKGRRDYAILLLASKLGLRASDITGLKFKHILWEQHLISFPQMKTKRNIHIPLLPEIGNAIIDYLKNGRPVSNEPYCFLQLLSPYKPLNPGSIGNIARYHLKMAGINFEKRRHGPHALRHSLAGSLLEDKTPIPVISSVLGHASSQSTMFYLRIDRSSLKQCALNVPSVARFFYDQKGEQSHA